jgi:hypothetical protein
MESVWWLLGQLYEKGLIYKGYTIQPYSPAAGTGLSSHELNQPGCYQDVKDTSCVAQFKAIKDDSNRHLPLWRGIKGEEIETVHLLAWTTTPWTLPSNTALTVGNNIDYVLVKTFNQYKTTDFKITHERGEKIGYKEIRRNFIELWTDDEDIRIYQTMNFYPLPKTESEMDEVRWNKSNTEDVFNLFLGYNNIINSPLPKDDSIHYDDEPIVDEEKVLKVIQSWRDIVLNLCEGDEGYYNFYVNFLSLKLLDPTNRLGIAIILEGLQGSFKNAHIEPIKTIIGRRHAFETANIEDILGTHAEGTINKLLLILNELEGKDSMDFEGKLKSLITEDSIVSNMKFQKPISIAN